MAKENKEVILSVKDLKINFSTDHGYVQAVRGISFDLYKGETLCIVGESGSGKSATSKSIMGILSANGRVIDGSIMYEGEDLTKVSEDEFHRIRGHKIGMIFQDPLSSLNPIVRIGKQITEAMLINSSHLKRMYEDLVAKELVAYRNAQTERKNGILVAKDNISFLKSERKKIIAQTKLHATEVSEGALFNAKQQFKSNINDEKEEIKAIKLELLIAQNDAKATGASVDEAPFNERIYEHERKIEQIKIEFAEMKAIIQKGKVDSLAKAKEVIAKLNVEYAEKIAQAKADYKLTKTELNNKYIPIIKETRIAYKARSKVAKKEVKEFKAQTRDDFIKEFLGEFKMDTLLNRYLTDNNAFVRFYTYQRIKDVVRLNRYLAKTHRENIKVLRLYDEYISKLKITKREAKAKAIEIMREVGIPQPERRFRQYPFEFSGGMRQRIVIAIALTADPDILICDEPTTALDVTIQAQILELINRLKRERNLSCIFITHDLGVVANMADRVAVMYAGKIVEYGTEEEIFYDPKHPYTWALLSSIPDVDSKEQLESIPGTPPNMIYPPKGDAFALRSKYALAIDFKKEPPLFKVSETHYAATWLLDPRAPKVEMPDIVKTRIANSLKAAKSKEAK